jgi:hypothetical protein
MVLDKKVLAATIMAIFLVFFSGIMTFWFFYSTRIRGHWIIFSNDRVRYRALYQQGELLYCDIANYRVERLGSGHILIIWPKKEKKGIKLKDFLDFSPEQIDEIFQELKKRVPDQNKMISQLEGKMVGK